MKHFPLLILILGTIPAISQVTDPVNLEYTEVFESQNSKDNLFKNAKTWIAKSFGEYNKVLQFEDREAGKIVIKGITEMPVGLVSHIKYILTIDVKENKYRFAMTDIEQGINVSGLIYLPVRRDIHSKFYEDRNNEIENKIKLTKKKKEIVELTSDKKTNQDALRDNIEIHARIDEEVKRMQVSLQSALNKNDEF